ncbi:hypothetical protein [Albimonas pacifica]|uniref:Uncharacterized protein n=1 Tax=Albimonas pacifica TaxID=1114924 RepID=A0A1I3DZL1_9RHOB|nr:hypothetical protein [Albimonas pacifica]SFH91891.1 hypothetical protein SAMN05216258_10389 [Albimonas pacifica]
MTRPNRFATAIVAALTAGAVAGPALAGIGLPEASKEHWTAHTITEGRLAQINAKGEGRFAVYCMPGDKKGAIFYREPAAARDEVRAAGDKIDVVFTFDGANKIERTMTWNEEGQYWTDPFGPNSPLADHMKRYYEVRINVKGHKGVDSDFTLKDSWRSIETMFSGC